MDAITEDLETPWEYKDVAYTYNITGSHVVPVLFMGYKKDIITEQKRAIVESYDGRHSLDATKVFHNRLICSLEMLTVIWGRSEKKAEVESEMASILKTLKLEKELKK